MQTAHVQLKGALQNSKQNNEADSGDELEDLKFIKKRSSQPARGRPSKKFKVASPVPHHQTYVMKLFDRSVDLAKFPTKSALYPICRAWMVNQPRARNKIKYEPPSVEPRMTNTDILNQIKDGIKLKAMPEYNEMEQLPTCPPLIQSQIDSNRDNINLDYDIENPPVNTNTLLADHKIRWGNVKSNWYNQSKLREMKYNQTREMLQISYQPKYTD